MALHEIDAAETQREWDFAVGKLVLALLITATPDMPGRMEMIGAVAGRISAGFKPKPHRPAHIITAREDALWLRVLPEQATLAEAMAEVMKIRGVPEAEARRRVLRAEKELRRKFLRTKPWAGPRRQRP